MYPRGEIALWGMDRHDLKVQLLLYDHLAPGPLSEVTVEKPFWATFFQYESSSVHNFFSFEDTNFYLSAFDSSSQKLSFSI